jgi:hypothetical protein
MRARPATGLLVVDHDRLVERVLPAEHTLGLLHIELADMSPPMGTDGWRLNAFTRPNGNLHGAWRFMCFWSLFCSYCPGVGVRLARGELRAMALPDPTALAADTGRPGNLPALLQPQLVTLMVYALDLGLVEEDRASRAGVYA